MVIDRRRAVNPVPDDSWDDPVPLLPHGIGAYVAAAIGDARASVMRGNGAITVGDTLEQAASLGVFSKMQRGSSATFARWCATRPRPCSTPTRHDII